MFGLPNCESDGCPAWKRKEMEEREVKAAKLAYLDALQFCLHLLNSGLTYGMVTLRLRQKIEEIEKC